MTVKLKRFNERVKRPNYRINFIHALPGSKEELKAQDFLNRIAAKVVPIMNRHEFSVTSLVEYEANAKFWGRNWNSGEVNELVLKSRTGSWLPFKTIESVMIHELSHVC